MCDPEWHHSGSATLNQMFLLEIDTSSIDSVLLSKRARARARARVRACAHARTRTQARYIFSYGLLKGSDMCVRVCMRVCVLPSCCANMYHKHTHTHPILPHHTHTPQKFHKSEICTCKSQICTCKPQIPQPINSAISIRKGGISMISR